MYIVRRRGIVLFISKTDRAGSPGQLQREVINMATRTPAKKATAKKAPAKTAAAKAVSDGPRVIKSGGAKGAKVVDAIMKAGPNSTRSDIAADAGCTVGRVGEVVRWIAANGTPAEKDAVAALAKGRQSAAKAPAKKTAKKAATPPRKAAAKKASPKVAPPKNEDDWDKF